MFSLTPIGIVERIRSDGRTKTSFLLITEKFDYDLAILGGGSAGYAAARTAAAAGLKTVVVEGGREVGGLCILRGCMPSKALLQAAEVLHLARRVSTWGLWAKSVGFDFRRVMARKTHLIGNFAEDRRRQLEGGKFDFRRASARFVDAHTLECVPIGTQPEVGLLRAHSRRRKLPVTLSPQKGAQNLPAAQPVPFRLTARKFVVATGSVISPPPLPFLRETGYLTSDDALSLRRLPRSLIILGGGAIACELAQYFARLDVRVTLLQRSPHVLRGFDADAAGVIETVLGRDGVRLFTGTKLLEAWRDGAGKGVTFEQGGRSRRVKAEEILFALGRSPNTGHLGLEHAGVSLDQGRIVTNARMQTSAPHIFAAGDCTGPHEIVHVAIQQAEFAAHNVVHPRRMRELDYRLLLRVVFTEPQVAAVGLTQAEATARRIPCFTASHPFDDHGKSLILDALDGFVKLLANPDTGEILGGACVGPFGGELIHEIVAAMAGHLTVQELAFLPHYHPTLAEIWTYPAEELAARITARREPVRGERRSAARGRYRRA